MPHYDAWDVHFAERMEKRYQREHDLLNTRTSIFSVLQTLLIAASGLMIRDGTAPPSLTVMLALPVMGFGGSLLWLMLGYRTRAVQSKYSKLLGEAEDAAYEVKHRMHKTSVEFRTGTLGLAPPLHASTILGLVFPMISLMAWIVIVIDFLG